MEGDKFFEMAFATEVAFTRESTSRTFSSIGLNRAGFTIFEVGVAGW